MPLSASFYREKIEYCKIRLSGIKKKINLYAVLRLIGFISFIGSLYIYFNRHEPVFLIYAIGFLIIFIWLIKISLDLKDKQLLFGQLLYINENEMGLAEGLPSKFGNGQLFQSSESFLADLDVFGEKSLYHLLNRTTTSHGSARLAELLTRPFLKKTSILDNQDAIKIMAVQVEHRQLLTAYGLICKEEKGNLHGITEWLRSHSKLNQLVWLQITRLALPVFNLAATWFWLDTGRIFPLLTGAALSSLLTAYYIKYINRQHSLISKKQEILDQYASIIKVFYTIKTGSSEKLKNLQLTVTQAGGAIGSLSRLSAFFDQRYNLIVASFFNIFFLYDLQCLLSLEKWKERYKSDFVQWINAVADIEYLNSFSTFWFNNPDYSFPSVFEGILEIEAKQMAHPLIPEKERVPNDFSIGKNDRLQLITGSNMSGKTTFLRTIGINLLLAQCGAPVCAAYFSFSPVDILTSIRISDSLMEHTSYFMAELKRLKQIIVILQKGQPALVMVDEILRGTNSEDKTQGSQQFIRKLLQYNCLALFATHDLSLSILENEFPESISNYCFESIIKDDELNFDYTLQRGVAKNRNASFLMKKMDII